MSWTPSFVRMMAKLQQN